MNTEGQLYFAYCHMPITAFNVLFTYLISRFEIVVLLQVLVNK